MKMNQKQIQRFALWSSAFPVQTYSAIRLHEILWMHIEEKDCLESPPIPRLLFAYVTGGSGILNYCGRTYPLQKGEAVVFDMREQFKTVADSENGLDFVSIQMSSALAETLFSFIQSEKGIAVYGDPEMLPLCERIYELASSTYSSRRDILISAALYQLLGVMHTSSAGERRMDAALQYIHAHFAEELPLELLASKVNLSLYHFIRCFKQEMGVTPHAYIRDFRINQAKSLLLRNDVAISSIASFVGYEDASHFSNIFRRSVGMLPREYRSLYLKK